MFDKPRLLTPGPTPIPEKVRLALAKDMIHHRKAAFKKIMSKVQEKLKILFQTKQPVLPLSCSGTGAMEAAMGNLFSPGEKVLVIKGGKFGQRWEELAKRHGLRPVGLDVPWGKAVQPTEVQRFLDQEQDLAGILVQASETSTGVLHPICELGELTAKTNTLLVVDGISAVGISPCPMDLWQIDCLLTGSQKGLMLPPGLALISLSERAWEKAEQVSRPFYFDLCKERANCQRSQTSYTSAVNLIVGLDVVLEEILDQGLEKIYHRQWALTQLVRTGIKALGLSPLAARDYTWGLTSVLLPPEVDGQKVLKLAAQRYQVFLAGGQEHLKGKIVRIGHMGHVDWGDLLAGLTALAKSISAFHPLQREENFLEQAFAAYEQALDNFDYCLTGNKQNLKTEGQ